MDKCEWGITLIVIGVAIILTGLIIPKKMRSNWFLGSGPEEKHASRYFGFFLIIAGLLVLIF